MDNTVQHSKSKESKALCAYNFDLLVAHDFGRWHCFPAKDEEHGDYQLPWRRIKGKTETDRRDQENHSIVPHIRPAFPEALGLLMLVGLPA